MATPQERAATRPDLSGSPWRLARARTAVRNPVAPYGLQPSSGQLFGPGSDVVRLTIDSSSVPVDVQVATAVALGERGPVLALLDWAERRGVITTAVVEALAPDGSSSGRPRQVPLRAFHRVITDIVRECARHDLTGWGLYPSADAKTPPILVLLPSDPPTTLLATPTAAVGIGTDGLHLLKRHITLTAWCRTEHSLMLTTSHGQHHLGPVSLSAQLLAHLSNDAPAIELRPVLMADHLAPVLTKLSALGALASTTEPIDEVLVAIR